MWWRNFYASIYNTQVIENSKEVVLFYPCLNLNQMNGTNFALFILMQLVVRISFLLFLDLASSFSRIYYALINLNINLVKLEPVFYCIFYFLELFYSFQNAFNCLKLLIHFNEKYCIEFFSTFLVFYLINFLDFNSVLVSLNHLFSLQTFFSF